MPRTHLRETLEELERELERSEAVDPESRRLLDHVIGEVQDLLERTEAREAEPEDQTVLERIAEATRHFEESHPAIAETVGRLAAALSNLGI